MRVQKFILILALAFLLSLMACAPLRPAQNLASTESLSVNPTPIPMPTLAGAYWHLVFHDEFNAASLRSVWSTELPWGPTDTDELEYYVPDALGFNDGFLRITAQKQPFQEKDYTSGIISTYPQFSFTYGYAEIRAKLPSGKGLWPAFWLLASDQKSSDEIDVFELLGGEPNTIYMTLHYETPPKHLSVQGTYNGPDFTQSFHTFAVDWEPTQVVWYVDGIEDIVLHKTFRKPR